MDDMPADDLASLELLQESAHIFRTYLFFIAPERIRISRFMPVELLTHALRREFWLEVPSPQPERSIFSSECHTLAELSNSIHLSGMAGQ
jgi:hypothetical protein